MVAHSPPLGVVLHRTIYGRRVLAIGQNPRAARLAGVPVDRVRFATYVLCAALRRPLRLPARRASPAAPRSTWARNTCSTSIAVVVIGGTSVAGGNSNVPGIWGAALLLFLVVTMLNTYGFGAGVRYR